MKNVSRFMFGKLEGLSSLQA